LEQADADNFAALETNEVISRNPEPFGGRRQAPSPQIAWLSSAQSWATMQQRPRVYRQRMFVAPWEGISPLAILQQASLQAKI
jgi:hypothetical protein